MTARIIKITDGTDTVDFEDASSGYTLLAFRPAVAQYDRDNPEVWRREDEQLEISVEGSTPTEMSQRLHLLAELIDRAGRMMRSEAVDPVVFQYRIDDSLLTNPLQSLVTGPPESGDVLMLPAAFDGYTQLKVGTVDDPVVWRLRRRGAWLGDEESQSEAAATANNPGVMSVTFGSATSILSPVELALALDVAMGASASAMLLLAKSSAHIDIVEAEDGVYSSADWADAADANASNGNVARYTPGSTDVELVQCSVTMDADVRQVAVVANLKNRSATINYYVRAVVNEGQGRWYYIDSSNNNPQAISLGVIRTKDAITVVEIQVQADATGSSANSLDVDTVAATAVDDGVGRVIALPELSAATFTIDPALLDEPRPLVYESAAQAYRGNVYLMQIGTGFAAVLLGNTGTTWRLRDDKAAAITVGMTATRRPAYVAPR